jgi:hypothetical protein
MRKFAIFVEGQTELITVRELLLKKFCYLVSIECMTLFAKDKLEKAPHPYKNPNAQFHFQLIDIGNDNAVLSRILDREKGMWTAGYERIIGLRDMYSEAYRDISSQIDNKITQRFIDEHNKTIKKQSQCPDKIMICFAIMEIEAWFLGMYQIFERLDTRLTVEYIKTQTEIDLKNVNPETAFFHPANQMEAIYKIAGLSYDKKKGDIEAIAQCLTQEDYTDLINSGKCHSFHQFYQALEEE